MRRRTMILAAIGAATLLAGISATLLARGKPEPAFHDFRVMSHEDFTALVDPGHPEVAAKARELKTHEAAYRFVRDEVRFLPFMAASGPQVTLREGASSCLGKAALLCSLYRALGSKPEEVRVVTGIVGTPAGLAEHAWVDLEYGGNCMQQDATDFLGTFPFDEFPDSSYVEDFVFKENFCFNDKGFGVISQLNRMQRKAD